MELRFARMRLDLTRGVVAEHIQFGRVGVTNGGLGQTRQRGIDRIGDGFVPCDDRDRTAGAVFGLRQ